MRWDSGLNLALGAFIFFLSVAKIVTANEYYCPQNDDGCGWKLSRKNDFCYMPISGARSLEAAQAYCEAFSILPRCPATLLEASNYLTLLPQLKEDEITGEYRMQAIYDSSFGSSGGSWVDLSGAAISLPEHLLLIGSNLQLMQDGDTATIDAASGAINPNVSVSAAHSFLCQGCAVEIPTCPDICDNCKEPAPPFPILIVTGGYDGADVDLVETIPLGMEGYDVECDPMEPFLLDDGSTAKSMGAPVICGGEQFGSSRSSECYIYDLKVNNWTLLANMTQSRDEMRVTQLNKGDFWVTGGESSSNGVLNANNSEIYRHATGQFEPGPDIGGGIVQAGVGEPGFDEHCVVKVSQSEFVLSGGGNDELQMLLYNFIDDSWTRLPDMPSIHQHHGCGVITNHTTNQKEIVFYGSNEDFGNHTDIFNMETRLWRRGMDYRKREDTTSVPFGDTFLVIGGDYDNNEMVSSILQWDQSIDGFIERPESLVTAREDTSAVIVYSDSFPVCRAYKRRRSYDNTGNIEAAMDAE